jgi:SAM-dependent methyltransferase
MRNYYNQYWTRPEPPPRTDPRSVDRRRLLWSVVMRDCGDSRLSLLELGSGEGDLVAEAESRSLEATGIELSTVAINCARRRYPHCTFIEHSIEDEPWPVSSGSYDVAVSFEVIEHLTRPRCLLEGASRALRPGGHLALTTPYHGIFKNTAISVFGFDKHYAVEGDHIRFFSDSALRRLLHDTGFAVRRTQHYGRVPGLWEGVFVWAQKQ